VTRLTILMYHRVAAIPSGTRHPENFVSASRLREQLEGLLSLGYEPITFAQWLSFRAHHAKIPRLPFIVTFDDGYSDFQSSGWPILQQLKIPTTVFVVASQVGLVNEWDRDEPRAALLDDVAIRELEGQGVSFGGHGFMHVPLADVSPNEARDDITRCHSVLSALLSRPPEVFAYPYSNQNSTVRHLARQAGFHCAVRGKGRLNARWTDPFGLHRILMHEGITDTKLRRMLMRLRWLTLA
jgi:peptidoglycan/xylan/chitin deacetylase (PgdA/CDA1 family)